MVNYPDQKLSFNPTNPIAITIEREINYVKSNYHTLSNTTATNNSKYYSELIKYLKFYANSTIDKSQLGPLLQTSTGKVSKINDIWPDISFSTNSSNNVKNILSQSNNTTLYANNTQVLTGDFTLIFTNKNTNRIKKYRVKNNGSITNYALFIYNVPNEFIHIEQTDLNNITYESFNTEQLLSHKFVNLVTLANDNVNLVLVDGTSIEVIYNNLPIVDVSGDSSGANIQFIRNCNDVSINYSDGIFDNSFSIDFSNNSKIYKVNKSDIKTNNLIVYVHNLYNEDISFTSYTSSASDIFVYDTSKQSPILNDFVNLINYTTEDYSLLVIDGMYLYNTTTSQPNYEDVFIQYKIDISVNDISSIFMLDNSNTTISLT